MEEPTSLISGKAIKELNGYFFFFGVNLEHLGENSRIETVSLRDFH